MIATNDIYSPGIRKAAVFVASLDRAAADLLLDQLGPDCADLVRQAVMEIEHIDGPQRQQIVEEFRRIEMMVPDRCPAGIDLDGPVSWKAPSGVGAATANAACVTAAAGAAGLLLDQATNTKEARLPFGFLREAENEKLSRLLSSERPQAIALVLSHLPPERAGNVLAGFAPPLQAEVVVRLTELERTDPETLQEVEQALEARLARLFADERGHAAGPDTVARILSACDDDLAGTILDNVAAYDAMLAERLGRRPITFDDLADLEDGALLGIFRAADPEVAQAALLGAPPQLIERILRRMIPQEAKLLRRRLDCPEPIRLSDIDQARRQIAELAQRKLRNRPRPAAAA